MKLSLLILAFLPLPLLAQEESDKGVERLWNNTEIFVEGSTTFSDGDFAPFWLTTNHYGVSSIKKNSAYLRTGIARSIETDSLRQWRIGYGADFVLAKNFTSKFFIQQLYAEAEYKGWRFTFGSKEREMELKNDKLSTGELLQSINAHPIPQFRIDRPYFWSIPGTRGWLSVKGHFAYGWFTDGSWNESFTSEARATAKANGTNIPRYYKKTLYHSKAGFLRIGNDEKFPLSFTGGFQMCAQFGGEAWNVSKRPDDDSDFDPSHVKQGRGFSSFWHAFIPGGSDESDGNFKNNEGNLLGDYLLSLDYHGKGWSIRTYADHFFEDSSGLFWDFGWKDWMWGWEVNLPKNPFVKTLLYEYLTTKDQSSGIYHDDTPALDIHNCGIDNYYNHNFYGWQHWGQAVGNPLLLSPIYNSDTQLMFYHNRIMSHHAGISGFPTEELQYRLLWTFVKSWGTYYYPTTDPLTAHYYLIELNYQPKRLKGWNFTASCGINHGSLIGKSTGGQITIRKTFSKR